MPDRNLTACMVERFTDLERGQPASETGRKHIPVRLYKQAGRLNGQQSRMQESQELAKKAIENSVLEQYKNESA